MTNDPGHLITNLVQDGLIRPFEIDGARVDDGMALAHRDLDVARGLLGSSSDWAFTVPYNAVLQAGRALMFKKGYRPDGSIQHVSVVRFCSVFVSPSDSVWFERMRRKRHQSVYDCAGSVSRREAEDAVEKAEEIVGVIAGIIRGN